MSDNFQRLSLSKAFRSSTEKSLKRGWALMHDWEHLMRHFSRKFFVNLATFKSDHPLQVPKCPRPNAFQPNTFDFYQPPYEEIHISNDFYAYLIILDTEFQV